MAALAAASAAAEPDIAVVLGYEGLARYASAAEYRDPEAYPGLFRRFVYERYRRQCANEGSSSQRLLLTPLTDIEALNRALDDIDSVDVTSVVAEAVKDAHGLLPIDKLTVCVFVYPPEGRQAALVREQMGGVMGFSEASGVLWLQLLPTEGWQEAIAPALAHEYYHAVNHPDTERATRTPTLLDYLVNEGGADSFTAELYPDFVPAWTHAIDLDQQRAVWPEFERQLDSSDPAIVDLFLFGDGTSVPRQAGYTIGFEIVQAYLAIHPQQRPTEWSRLDAKTILDASGYRERMAGPAD